MPSRILRFAGSFGGLEASIVILVCRIRRNKDSGKLEWHLAGIDHLMVLALLHPERHVFPHDCFFPFVETDSATGDHINQFRTVVHVIVRASIRRKDRVTERQFLDASFVRCKQNLNLPPVRCRNLNSRFLPSADLFQDFPLSEVAKPTRNVEITSHDVIDYSIISTETLNRLQP